AKRYWQARADFKFVAPAASLEECLAAALAEDAPRPYVISDSGDNPTAGGSGDVTWTLRELLADSTDDIRLLAYGMLDGAEKQLTQQI
ncbi:MlrC C-terminal domain-containing protein, partial [Escherichia coli]|uniref:MlrC C-terminal domain-containing protein n=1 Tax=Escherichia coli TaxID=562 RepID=UPI001EDC721F